ncbi:CAP domain-containing protein [Natronincola ferrireducens]|uniref:Cysteine-rich secretory protein family protein n=1 Tax=Natronincola ferrireducens TaxID=393762 RepID=A0A1G9E0H8_9FIRM|nr:CAP-associated domain-containing protein [Natronincola ferrireducens]SDK69588.1 Cysteine-rich secretory protein family protein [Natronincola ferrireducens]
MRSFKRVMMLILILWLITMYRNTSLINTTIQREGLKGNISGEKISYIYNNSIEAMAQKTAILNNIDLNWRTIIANFIININDFIGKKDNNSSVVQSYTEKEFVVLDIEIGDSVEKVIELFGQPNRKDLSKYGFDWYIYNEDYSKYIQIGIKDEKVVGVYTNSPAWQSRRGIQVGSNKEVVNNLLGEPLEYLIKGNTFYYLSNPEESDTYLVDNYYATIFYDLHNEYRVTAIQLIDKNIEKGLQGFYGEPSEELRESFERQVFDLTNATRVRFGKPPLQWEDTARIAARGHSKDMAKRNFFSHDNPDGKGPSDRIEAQGIYWQRSGENIAAGQTCAIFAHENWMNSIGHRESILGDFKRLGVGVYFGGEYTIYYTQNFYTPR